ncbi:hypothetical protein Tco_1031268 [Tanacetum coccineum]|uniref:Uncharacterized protein n=1 Tax=Tanacetum coccineum TaxID=301880 RepID=A0ABQ5GAI9_9ASTR
MSLGAYNLSVKICERVPKFPKAELKLDKDVAVKPSCFLYECEVQLLILLTNGLLKFICSLRLGIPFVFACFPLLIVDLMIAFMSPSPDGAFLVMASLVTMPRVTLMSSLCTALLPNRTLYLDVDMTIWNGNMIVFVNGCVPTILLTLYEAIIFMMTTGSTDGMNVSHGVLRDGMRCQSSALSVMLSGSADSIMSLCHARSHYETYKIVFRVDEVILCVDVLDVSCVASISFSSRVNELWP